MPNVWLIKSIENLKDLNYTGSIYHIMIVLFYNEVLLKIDFWEVLNGNYGQANLLLHEPTSGEVFG